MKRLLLLSALSLAGCYTKETPQPSGLGSFQVTVKGIYEANTNPRKEVPVVAACAAKYGGIQSAVPMDVRGTKDCLLALPRTVVEIDLEIQAMDVKGQPMADFNGPASFRTVPGNLTGPYRYRWAQLTNGRATGSVRTGQLYGETHVWVEDEPVQVDYTNGEVVPGELPQEPAHRTSSTGLSRSLFFEEPTIATVQVPQNGNQQTAYSGTFMRIGRAPEAGPALVQNCAPDDPNNGQPVTLLVTGTDPGGFFVTDLTACQVREGSIAGSVSQFTAEPSGFYPGRFNSMFIYNYSFPEGLDPGDLLWSIAGSVQEFTSTTQLTFPSWNIREKVRLLPQAEWNKYLDLAKPVEINGRLCGYTASPYITDPLCGYNYGNYKMEGLESSLVKVRRVKFPTVFKSCDANGNNTVATFCQAGSSGYGACGTDSPTDTDVPERQCNIDCTLGRGEFRGKLCTEKTTYDNFGQFVVEMNPTGAPAAGLDDSVPARLHTVNAPPPVAPATELWTRSPNAYTFGATMNIWCDKPAHVRFGGTVQPGPETTVSLAATTRLERTLTSDQSVIWISPQDALGGVVTCTLAQHPNTRINLVTKDAVPDLVVQCNPNDSDTEKAKQCQFLQGATFDVVGHLRHVGAARPRWVVLPRDQDDLCCYPGPGLECPRPIKPCVTQ
ncbi:hypothetical protein NVS55_15510 [Myxococcus stipitatus]|uniref:hypothetical protein n=1 Tax=Myxococcus stipitatus TaxID=83455 RepID=UPI0031456170